MIDQYRFSILTFPQRVHNNALSLNILLLPQLGTEWNGNPLLALPLVFADPDPAVPFAEANLAFEARIISDPRRFPSLDAVDARSALAAVNKTPDAPAIYAELQNQFQIKDVPAPDDFAEAPRGDLFIKKYLPQTYRSAFHFTHPGVPEAVTDDSYHCAVKEDQKINPAFNPSPPEITWGEVYAYCLRHPLLSRRLGLVREATLPVDAATFEQGGYLFVTLGAGSDYLAGQPPDGHFNFIRHYAARIPALEPGQSRTLFAANLFPVLTAPGGPDTGYDQVLIDTAEYDDGFCKIVHARQPVSQNLLEEEEDGFPPVYDLGIQQSWDDEKVLQWMNRQLKERDDMPGTRLDAPMGVFAYRVDTRVRGGGADWHSLVRVRSKNPLQIGPVNLGVFEGELGVEVHPMQLGGDQANGQFWLPSYFSAWNGRSLVLPDEYAALLYHTETEEHREFNLGRLYDPAGLDAISLQYGSVYEFRVRLMDLSGGGPALEDNPLHEAPAPLARVRFKRYVKPEPLRIESLPSLPQDTPDATFSGDVLTVRRPLLGYPAVIYTGKYDDAQERLLSVAQAAVQAAAQGIPGDSIGLPDPDVLQVRIDVEVRSLMMDNLLSLSGEEPFIRLYTTVRDFPAAFDAPLSIPLTFRDANILNFGDSDDLGDLGLSEQDLLGLAELVLPAGREIRLTLRGMGAEDDDYFGGTDTWTGKPLQLKLRRNSKDERQLFADLSDARKIRGIYLQPDEPRRRDVRVDTLTAQRGAQSGPAMIDRLAQQLDVEHKGLTLVGEAGQRVVFGCSRRIRHTLAPDNSSITFASKDELLNHWIVPLTFQLDRDWTWDMVEEVSFEIFREQRFSGSEVIDDNQGHPVGDLELKATASINALQNPDRSKTTLIYLDAVEPKSTETLADDPGANVFPDTIELDYRIAPRFKAPPDLQDEPEALALPHLALPVTTPPAQVPRLVSAGLALSRYERNDAYSRTEPRERYLWLEFEEPVRDPNDRYFIRLLGYAPDPLLAVDITDNPELSEDPPIALDPEYIRVIAPGHSDDQAGLSAMKLLEPATNSMRHFLVPLPPGLHPQSNELFGFFTYEMRVGHADIWSTAQGRFGRPLRTTGVQHPSPTLFCTGSRGEGRLVVEATHATAVQNGKNVTADPPRTELWVLLYAQVRQADGKDNRNILLDDRLLSLVPRRREEVELADGSVIVTGVGKSAPARSSTQWEEAEIKQILAGFGLPTDASLSVICVEMMPHLVSFMRYDDHRLMAAMPQPGFHKPLTKMLGHFRILRTSPLTPVNDIC